jgi:alanine racemase
MNRTSFSVRDIINLANGHLIQGGLDEIILPENITIDSRKYRGKPNSAFFAIVGKINNGHHYLETVYYHGVRVLVISEGVDPTLFPEAVIIKVADTLQALQKIAAIHRSKFQFPVIGITGSNAKTIVKEWIYECLYQDFNIVRSPRSFNSQVGVPLSLLLTNETHNLGIFEAGISLPSEMKRLSSMIEPSIGIFTNIGDAHQKNFQSLEEKIDEKLELFRNVDFLIFCTDHETIKSRIKDKPGEKIPNLLTWSFKGESDLRIVETQVTESGTSLKAIFKGREITLRTPFFDKASLENVCHVWRMLLHFDLDQETINNRVELLKPVAMRLEKLEGINNCLLINDTYNSDIHAIQIALDVLLSQGKNQRFTAIISDILETGVDKEELYQKLFKLLQERKITRFIGVGPELEAHRSIFDGISSLFYPNTDALLRDIPNLEFHQENILIKGARNYKFERISGRLEKKSHETVLEIDLTKMGRNLTGIRSKLRKGTKIMVMVKAFAYGSRDYDVARFLEYNRADYLAVAYIDEGITLRKNGITMPIMVLNPEESGYDAMIRYELEPQIYSFRTAEKFVEALKHFGKTTPYPIHIKLNTGMNRLGFDEHEVAELREYLDKNSLLEVNSIFSHLAASDDAKFNELTGKQIGRFETMASKLNKPGAMKHILNSSGILRFPDCQYDMVRLGIALYGISSSHEFKAELEPVSKLRTVISQIRKVNAGEGVGYSPKSFLKESKVIGVIPIGYADGLRRKLGNGNGKVFVNGQAAPFIGNICMDMAMIDLTGIRCEEGETVEIFGQHQSVYDLAKDMETIPYEVLTSISQRVRRVFIQE